MTTTEWQPGDTLPQHVRPGAVMTFLEDLDDDTPCGRCGHAHGWHAAINDFTDCRHDFGTPDQCECPRWEEPNRMTVYDLRMNRRSAASTTAVTVVPSAAAFATDCAHRSGSIRSERGIFPRYEPMSVVVLGADRAAGGWAAAGADVDERDGLLGADVALTLNIGGLDGLGGVGVHVSLPRSVCIYTITPACSYTQGVAARNFRGAE